MGDRFLKMLKQLVFYRGMYEKIVGGDTGLARVDEFSNDDPSRSDAEIGILFYDDRAFPTQLEGYGDQLFRCQPVDGMSYRDAAGEEDMIEPEFADQCRYGVCAVTLDDLHEFGWKEAGQELFDDGGCSGCEFRRF